MIVCSRCLLGIESHEGHQTKERLRYAPEFDSIEPVFGEYDDNGDFRKDDNSDHDYYKCEFCDDYEVLEHMWVI